MVALRSDDAYLSYYLVTCGACQILVIKLAAILHVWKVNLGGAQLKRTDTSHNIALPEKNGFCAVLQKAFGKCLIYQSYSVAKSVVHTVAPAVIVVILLQSIAEEQVRNNEFGLKPLSCPMPSGKVRVLYTFAVEVLGDLFIDLLKQGTACFNRICG